MKMINSFEATSGALTLPPDLKDRIARRARLLGPAYRLFYREPLHIVRGAGVWLYDAAGREYLDAYNNVPVVGHCHPEVVAALSDQAQRRAGLCQASRRARPMCVAKPSS